MYYSISCALRIAIYFRSGKLSSSFNLLFGIDYFFDAIFILDVFLRMKVYAYGCLENGRNKVILDQDLMKKHYLSSEFFKIDLIAIMPYDILSLVFGYPTLFRTPKIIRVYQMPSIISRMQKNMYDCVQITMNEAQVSAIIMLLFSILIVIWSSAGWNAIRDDEKGYESVYWAFTTLTTVGYGDLTPGDFRETCFAAIVGALGATFTAAIVANVTSFFHDVDISEDNIDHKLNCIKVSNNFIRDSFNCIEVLKFSI